MVDLNLVWANNERLDIPQHPLVIEDTPTAEDQFRLTRLTIFGRLNGLDIELHDVIFERFYGGMDCQDFTVPAIGFGGKKGGIILTDKGPLEITQPNINVGCYNCVALISGTTNDHASFLQTPMWDQHVAGHSIFKKDGGVYWMAETAHKKDVRLSWSEPTCFDLNSETHFEVVDSKHCIKDKLLPVSPEIIEILKDVLPGADINRLKHDLHMIEGAPYYFYRHGISCS